MAKLTGQTIAASYDQLLIVDDANGISSSLQAIESADTGGSASSLKISTSKVEVIPASDSTSLFEVSKADGTAVLSVDTTNARVGIGDDSPDSRLHIKSSGNSSYPFKITNSANTNILAGIYQDAGGDSLLALNISDGTQKVKLLADGDSYFNGGNVGIGVTNPAIGLEVHHDAENGLSVGRADDGTSYIESRVGEVQNRRAGFFASVGSTANTGISSTVTLGGMRGVVKNASGALEGDLEFVTNAGDNLSTKMTIDGDGNVGIGTAPSDLLHLSASVPIIRFTDSDDSTYSRVYHSAGNLILDADKGGAGSKYMAFTVGDSERMRIDSSGNLLVGRTSVGSTGDGHSIRNADSVIFSRDGGEAVIMNRDSSHGVILSLRDDGVQVGTISTNANSLPSDRNFKRDISDLDIGLNFVNDLKPSYYNHKIDDADSPKMMGLIAQDVEQSLIDSGVAKNSTWLLQHEPVEDEKESDYHLDYVKLVPVLIKAIQELSAKVEALENA